MTVLLMETAIYFWKMAKTLNSWSTTRRLQVLHFVVVSEWCNDDDWAGWPLNNFTWRVHRQHAYLGLLLTSHPFDVNLLKLTFLLFRLIKVKLGLCKRTSGYRKKKKKKKKTSEWCPVKRFVRSLAEDDACWRGRPVLPLGLPWTHGGTARRREGEGPKWW